MEGAWVVSCHSEALSSGSAVRDILCVTCSRSKVMEENDIASSPLGWGEIKYTIERCGMSISIRLKGESLERPLVINN
jgi:hypothetical protein